MVNASRELPDGWTMITLSEIIDTLESGGRPKGGVTGISEGIPSVGGEHLVYDGGFDFTNIRYVPNNFYANMNRGKIKKNDVLLVKDGATTGKTSFVSNSFPFDKAAVNEHVFILRAQPEKVMQKYLFFWMQSPFGQKCVKDNYKGTAQGGITSDFIQYSGFHLAPLPEQERIVAKIEELFTQLEAGTSALERVRAGLRRYKASVLKAACEGKLVDQRGIESSDELPEGWQIVNLGAVLSEPLSNGKSTPNAQVGFPVLRLTTLKDGRIDLRERKIGAWTKEQAKNYLVKNGDFFVSRGNGSLHLVGRGGLVEQEPFDDVAYPDTLIRIRVSSKDCDIRYLRTIWNSNLIRHQIETTARTTAGIYKINQKDLERFTFPLPPLEEQRRIVAEVERRLSLAREVESAVEAALVRASRLRQTVLKSAFEGKL
jgi:type I restriction enzyme S subunit